MPRHAAEQAAGLPPREETRPRMEAAPSAPSAVKSDLPTPGKEPHPDFQRLEKRMERVEELLAELIGLMKGKKK